MENSDQTIHRRSSPPQHPSDRLQTSKTAALGYLPHRHGHHLYRALHLLATHTIAIKASANNHALTSSEQAVIKKLKCYKLTQSSNKRTAISVPVTTRNNDVTQQGKGIPSARRENSLRVREERDFCCIIGWKMISRSIMKRAPVVFFAAVKIRGAATAVAALWWTHSNFSNHQKVEPVRVLPGEGMATLPRCYYKECGRNIKSTNPGCHLSNRKEKWHILAESHNRLPLFASDAFFFIYFVASKEIVPLRGSLGGNTNPEIP